MGKTALFACVAVLIQVHLDCSQAAPWVNVKQTTTYKFKIDHALDMAYTTDAQRDSLLQQVFSLWNTILASYSPSNLKIKFLQQAPSVDAGHQIVQYRVSGDSGKEVQLQDVTASFESQLMSSGIAGVATIASLQSGSGGATVTTGGNSFTVDNQQIQISANDDNQLNDMLQQILNVWKTSLSQYQVSNVQINVVDKTPMSSGSGYTVTYTITGQSQNPVDVQQTVTQFQNDLPSANLNGVSIISSGGSSLAKNGGGGTSGGGSFDLSNLNPFTLDNQQLQLTYTSDDMLNNLLQQILSLYTTVLGQSGQVSGLDIKVVSKTPLGNNMYNVVYQITGQSSTGFSSSDVSSQIQSQLNSNPISGVASIGSSTGNNAVGVVAVPNGPSIMSDLNPFTLDNNQIQLTYTSTNVLNNLLQQILSLWNTVLGQSAQISGLDIKTVSKTPLGNNKYKVVYQITGQTSNAFNTGDVTQAFQSQLASNAISGVSLVGSSTGNTVNNLLNGGGSGSSSGSQSQWGNGGGMSQGQNMNMNQGQSTGGNGMSQSQNQNMGGGSTSWSLWGNSGTNNGGNTNVGGNTNGGQSQNLVNGGGSSSGSGTVVDRSKDKGGKHFQFTQDLLIQYTDNGQRDQYLQNQILGMWKYATGVYDTSKIKLVFLTSKPSPSTGSNFQLVTYRVTGTSDSSLDQQTVLNAYTQSVTNAGFSAIQLPSGVSSGNGGSDNNGGGAGGASFQIDTSALLKYTSSSQRDSLLQQLLNLFKTTFASQQLTSVSIVFIRDAAGQGNAKQVFYRITGQSGQGSLDVPSITSQFNQAITNANIANIGVNYLAGMTTNIENMGSNTGNGDNGDNGNGNDNNGGAGGASFQVDTSSLLTYTTSSQRDALLQQLLNLFKTTFASQQLTSVSIVFIREAAGQGNSKQVFYRITGQSGQGSLDVPTITSQFNQAISSAHIGSIAVNTVGSASTNIGNTIGSNTWNNNNNNNNNNNRNNLPVQIEDSVVASYTSQSQRDAYLQQLLALFKTTFSSYGMTNLKIVFTRDTPSTNGGKELFYRITGSSSQTFNSNDIINQFEDAISNANLAGITLPQSGGSTGSGSFPVDFSDNTLALTYTSNSQRDQLLQQILAQWQTVLSQYQINNLQIKFTSAGAALSNGAKVVTYHITGTSGSQFSYNDVLSAFQQAIQNANINGVMLASDAQSSDNSGSGSFPISINRNDLALTYTSSSQRDSLLQQILALWQTVFAQYQATNLQIKFISDTTQGQSGGHIVTYTLTGTAGMQFDMNTVVQAFLDALSASPIQGVSLAGPIAAQVTSNVGAVLGGNGGSFSIPGSLKLTYKTDQERQTFLNQVLVMWRNSVWAYQVSNVQIKMTGVTGNAPTHTVSYVITGISALPIDLQAATDTFQTTLNDSHLTGITYA